MRSIPATLVRAALIGCLVCLCLCAAVVAQQRSGKPARTAAASGRPVVRLLDDAGIKAALQPKGKPLLVNFWATWCDPCREEFPDLVKLDAEYKGKVDFITVSLDDPADIATTVPKFLGEMKSEMPAYLLKSADESTLISSIARDWQGGLPFTIVYDSKGETAYFRQGKFAVDTLKAELDKVLAPPPAVTLSK